MEGTTGQPSAELSRLYPNYFHAEDWERAVELSAFLPSELPASTCSTG